MVSNAESQSAVPFMLTTVFAVSVSSSPKGSAVWAFGGVAGGGARHITASAATASLAAGLVRRLTGRAIRLSIGRFVRSFGPIKAQVTGQVLVRPVTVMS